MGETRPEAHVSLSPGDRIGPYEVIALVGAGGMGEVYRAHDHRLRRDAALKIVSPRFALDAARMARFAREAQIRMPGLALLATAHVGRSRRLHSERLIASQSPVSND